MKILFLTISTAIKSLENRGIYPDLINHFIQQGHEMFIVCPAERRHKMETSITSKDKVSILSVKTLNITKSGFLEKGLATLMIQNQFDKAIRKYFGTQHFDLILYTTPPITFNSLISRLKVNHKAKTYLLLKDIFPQNAVDLKLIKKGSIIYKFFRRKEKNLYSISDYIGCMSKANVDYVLNNNPQIEAHKVEICPNSIKIIDRSPSVLKKEEFLKKYNIPDGIPIFLYGGNLGIAQGIDFLIEVLCDNQNREDFFLLIIGGGNRSQLITEWINQYKPKYVKLIPHLDKKEFDTIESLCDVGLIFLDKNFSIPNFPSRMLSYMECKLPLLISSDKVTDVGEIATVNNFGLWSQSGNLNNFNKNLNFLINHSDYRLKMGQNGYEFLRKNYEVGVSYNIIMNHFEQIKCI